MTRAVAPSSSPSTSVPPFPFAGMMSSIPKFGSFKPKEATSKQRVEEKPGIRHEERYGSPNEKRDSSSRRHERRHHKDEPDRDKRQKRKHHSDRNRISSPHHLDQQPANEDLIAPDEFEESDLFIVDRRGDPKNVEFGSLHRYNVPAYHLFGYGKLVGADQCLRIDREQSTATLAVLSSTRDKERARAGRPLKSSQLAVSEKKSRLIVPAAPTDDPVQSDFIALRPGLKRKRGSEAPETVSTVDYRSIEGKAKVPAEPSDSDVAAGSDSDDKLGDSAELQIRQENAVLSKQTKNSPHDVETWLKLIAHQAKVIRPHSDDLSFSDKRAIADVRLAIYDQATKHITAGRCGHERLLMGMLDEGAVIWEASKLAKKWTEVLTRCPTSIALWTKYLDFVQTDHVNFSYESCRAAYLKCLHILKNARKADQQTDWEVALAQIWVTLRLTAFIRDAGYDELAYSIWQVLLEMTFFKPTSLSDDSALLQSLEDFWDADVPRIGEEGATGWAQHAELEGPTRKIKSQELLADGSRQSIQRFADQESRLLRMLHLPAAVDDDNSNEDPYRQVMFTDLKPFAETLLDDLPADNLIDGLLVFMGLPPMANARFSTSAAREWQIDPFIVSADKFNARAIVVQALEHTSFLLFDDAFVDFRQRVECKETRCFIGRILEQLVAARPDDDFLAEYHLAFQLAISPAEAPKLAKRLLKGKPSSLRLYNAYALIEARSGKISKAEEVWKTAVRMSGQFDARARDDLVLLWHSWVLCLLHADSERQALQTLLAMLEDKPDTAKADDSGASAAQMLKASRFFEEMWERSVYTGTVRLAAHYAECHIWFVYLTGQQFLSPAMAMSEKYAMRAEMSQTAQELIYQAQVNLVRFHLDHHRPYKPADLRLTLAKGLEKFPSNGLLIDTYARIGCRIEDRLRSSLWHDEASGDSSLVKWAHFLSEEIRRCDEASATAHAVRSSFNRALLSPDSRVRHSIALWDMWLRFESSRLVSDEQNQKHVMLQNARQVFLDGLRMLPWSKTWIITGLQLFTREGGMSNAELRQVYNILSERELRLRIEAIEI